MVVHWLSVMFGNEWLQLSVGHRIALLWVIVTWPIGTVFLAWLLRREWRKLINSIPMHEHFGDGV